MTDATSEWIVSKFKWSVGGKIRIARRMATQRFIAMARGEAIKGTEREIDSSLVDNMGQHDISIQPIV
jgi:hypothetical protein